jgi:hypothetical protein
MLKVRVRFSSARHNHAELESGSARTQDGDSHDPCQLSEIEKPGNIRCRNVKGTNVKSAHAEGRALDIGVRADRPGERLIGDLLFKAFIASAAKSGIDNVIWNRQIWSVQHGGPRPFVGYYPHGGPRNPHTDHIHVEWTRDGSQVGRLNFLELQVSIVRQGLEELASANRHTA